MNIATIEDPVEKNIERVNQMQINTMAGLTKARTAGVAAAGSGYYSGR